ncbi:MAG: hypothetical protein ACN4GM_16965 [Gammaproteobacteria bacterium]
MKYIWDVFLLIFFIVLISGCDNPGTNYELELYETSDGLVRYKSNNELFTGKFHLAVCEECSEPIFNHWPVHSVGHYKNGIKNGIFWHPRSGRSDDYFNYSDRSTQKILFYENGTIVDKDP